MVILIETKFMNYKLTQRIREIRKTHRIWEIINNTFSQEMIRFPKK